MNISRQHGSQDAAKEALAWLGLGGRKVTNENTIQWIGVWYCMLAFPQPGDRRAYFNKYVAFGSVHNLEEPLRLGASYERTKGIKWFENMHLVFALPVHTDGEVGDPFQAVLCMWDICRSVFLANVLPSWLLFVDELMVKWVCRKMPGPMVVPRKPTLMGLELHTVCCAVSGILVNFEIYEGKERMEAKQFVCEVNEFGPIHKGHCVDTSMRSAVVWLSTRAFSFIHTGAAMHTQ
eukprot:684307-Pleurochrysis_carterae.AAC.3